MVSEAFKNRCVHCDHYREKAGVCCFCSASPLDVKVKSREEHLAELDEILEGDDD